MKSIAEKVISLVLDSEIFKIGFDLDSEETMGAFIIKDTLNKHFSRHIISFGGITCFESSNSFDKISKILNKKLTYYMRRFDNEQERVGANKMFEHIKAEFQKIQTENK